MSQRIIIADVLDGLRQLPDGSVHCCVTSPPYWGLRDYGVEGQIGLEKTPAEFIAKMVAVFSEVRRVLRDDGVCWVNIGDSYAGGGRGGNPAESEFQKQATNAGSLVAPSEVPTNLKAKDLVGIPWMLAFAFRDDGWYLRQDIIWHKPAPMPESVRDRCTKAHEYIFLLTKNARYFMDMEAVKEAQSEGTFARFGNGKAPRLTTTKAIASEAGTVLANADYKNATPDAILPDGMRNLRSVWTIASQGFPGAHFATFPLEIPERCIRAGTSLKGCCPECGAPWRRVTESKRVPTRPGTNSKVRVPKGWGQGDEPRTAVEFQTPQAEAARREALEVGNRDEYRHVTETVTTGWKPTCAHAAEPIPCTVLDPFAGAATTLLAAQRLGRNGIGIELNPEYAAMGEKRLNDESPLFVTTSVT